MEPDNGSVMGQKVKLSRVVEGVTVEVIHGDVLSEKQDLISKTSLEIVNATFQCENSLLVKELGLQIKKNKLIGIQSQLRESKSLF
jgi:hypothetical protein